MRPLIKINKKFSYTKKFSLTFNSNLEIKLVNIRQKDKKQKNFKKILKKVLTFTNKCAIVISVQKER